MPTGEKRERVWICLITLVSLQDCWPCYIELKKKTHPPTLSLIHPIPLPHSHGVLSFHNRGHSLLLSHCSTPQHGDIDRFCWVTGAIPRPYIIVRTDWLTVGLAMSDCLLQVTDIHSHPVSFTDAWSSDRCPVISYLAAHLMRLRYVFFINSAGINQLPIDGVFFFSLRVSSSSEHAATEIWMCSSAATL